MHGVSFELNFGIGLGSYNGTFDGTFDGILKGSTLGVPPGSTDCAVLGFGEDIILGSSDG